MFRTCKAQRWAAASLFGLALSVGLAQAQSGLPVAPPPPATAPAPAEACPDIFAKVPPIQPFPRPGLFTIPPGGEGYYSAKDCLTDQWRKGPPKYPYPRFGIIAPSFFDIDWRYLDKPDNTDHDFFDCLKRIRLCDDFLFTTGGDIRYRYNYERNSRLLNTGPFAGRTNNYDLLRTRVYGDLMYRDQVRLYVEFLDAQSFNYLLPPLPIDRNHSDLLNAFVDLRTVEVDDRPVWLRVGRQELLYGSQRLVSTLDWANTRRTFQGVKAFWQGEKWSVDSFLVQPVIPHPERFDSVDNNQIFAGLWTTYKPDATSALDLYYLYLDKAGRVAGVQGKGNAPGGTNPSTFGARYVGASPEGWLWDVEGMIQFGEYANQALFAHAWTIGGGYQWKETPWTPMLWLGWEHASGDPSPGTGNVRRTFDQLFPFGHYYFGFIDVVGRRNIHDLTAQFSVWPTKWITTTLQTHTFFLARRKDALYNAAGAVARQDRTGRSGNYVGQEVDLLINFHLSEHSDILLSYSHLFAGDFIKNTASTPGGRRSPDYFYL